MDKALSEIQAESVRLASQYRGVFDAPPRDIPAPHTPGGPLMGNGDVGVTIGGPAEALTFYLGKNEFWSVELGAVVPLGRIALSIPALTGATYHLEQALMPPLVTGTFTRDLAGWRDERVEMHMRTWTAATANALLVELENTGSYDLEVTASLQDRLGLAPPTSGQEGDAAWMRAPSDLNRPWERPEMKVGSDGVTVHSINLSEFGATNGPFTISANVTLTTGDDCRVIGCDRWDEGVSLWVVGGRVRFTASGVYLESDAPAPVGRQFHILALFDGINLKLSIDGVECSGRMKLVKEPQKEDIWGPNPYFGCLWRGSGPPAGAGPRAVVAARFVGGAETAAASGKSGATTWCRIAPGETTVLAVSILSESDDPDFETAAIEAVRTATSESVESLWQKHVHWWSAFYGKSFVQIPNKVVEKHWYASLYLLGCSSKPDEVAPGLWGNWVTHPYMWWHGDYTLNYNYQAPFWGTFHSNHIELAECYDKPLLDWLPRGKAEALRLGYDGVFYLTHIGPLPGGSSDLATHGQKYQSIFALVNSLLMWRYTCDSDYLRRIYPLLIETASFWEGYLRFEDGRYVDHHDSAFECPDSEDMNAVAQLGMLRMLFSALLEASDELGVDSDRREKWQHILDHLSDYPICDASEIDYVAGFSPETKLGEILGQQATRGLDVYRYTESGPGWTLGNAVGLQHIFPPDLFGIESDPRTLEIARNTIHVHGLSEDRWKDGNGTPTLYPAAARVGYDAKLIISKLTGFLRDCSYPNMHPFTVGGGVECLSVVPSCLGEMLCQSHQGVINVFANWPREWDGCFGRFRASGAFLVTSEMKDGEVRYVTVESEKGQRCTLKNPWPERQVTVTRAGGENAFTGDYITTDTAPGETLRFAPGQLR